MRPGAGVYTGFATPRALPGSTFTFTRPQISDGFGPAAWFPGDHLTMPDIAKRGRHPDVCACSLCHYPNGKGRPESAGVAARKPESGWVAINAALTPKPREAWRPIPWRLHE